MCKWIKASERLPIIDNKNPKHYVFVSDVNHNAICIWTEFIRTFPALITANDICWKWLDESTDTPSHGRTAEEIRDAIAVVATELMDNLEIHKWRDYGDFEEIRDKDSVGCEIADAVMVIFNDYANQAMEEHRTQPQEGKEEVECTHPYKECVMSDRVNKYGTPLTKCSVCGNDNICDEELMDESVNTF